MVGLASAFVHLTNLLGQLVWDLLLGSRSGGGLRSRPSVPLCEHENAPRWPLSVWPLHIL